MTADERGASSKMSRLHFRRGVWVACGMFLCVVVVFAVLTGFSYDGKCGGFFPGLSVRQPCSFREYATGDMLVIAMIMGTTFWPWVLALLVLPPITGYLFDRREERRAA
jgi:hypothetical protein